MHAKQRNEAIRHVVAYVFTIAMVFLAVIPFIYVVLTALKTKEQIYDPSQIIPTHITFDNFRQVLFQSNFVRYFMNSIFITLVTTLICMILSVMAAYGKNSAPGAPKCTPSAPRPAVRVLLPHDRSAGRWQPDCFRKCPCRCRSL